MSALNRFLADLERQFAKQTSDRQRWLEAELAVKLKRMEGRIMSAVTAKIDEMSAAFDVVLDGISKEIDQLAAAVAATAPDLSADVAKVQVMIDKAKDASAKLAADDPAPPAPEPAPAPAADPAAQ